MAFVTEPTGAVLARAWAAGAGRRWLRLARELPVLPLAILVPFVLIALFAGAVAPYDPTEPIPGAKIFEPPFWVQGANKLAFLGTDFQGRDVLSRLIYGARDRRLAGAAGAGLRDLPGDDGRPQHVEHRHHPGARLLDPLRKGDPGRGA